MSLLNIEIPLKLQSAANLHEHWRKRHARIKSQREAVKLTRRCGAGRFAFDQCVAAVMRGEALTVTLTRISPRKLDSDNLAFAFKGIRDQVAEELGLDDGSDDLDWRYRQESGRPAIRIEIAKKDPWELCGRCGAKSGGSLYCADCLDGMPTRTRQAS
jgi:hypothetical protein